MDNVSDIPRLSADEKARAGGVAAESGRMEDYYYLTMTTKLNLPSSCIRLQRPREVGRMDALF